MTKSQKATSSEESVATVLGFKAESRVTCVAENEPFVSRIKYKVKLLLK